MFSRQKWGTIYIQTHFWMRLWREKNPLVVGVHTIETIQPTKCAELKHPRLRKRMPWCPFWMFDSDTFLSSRNSMDFSKQFWNKITQNRVKFHVVYFDVLKPTKMRGWLRDLRSKVAMDPMGRMARERVTCLTERPWCRGGAFPSDRRMFAQSLPRNL